MAVFRGFSPGDTVLGAELGLVQSKCFLLSTGLLGVENRVKPQPFLEGGYYHGKAFAIAGVQKQDDAYVAVLGAAYQATPRILATADYIGGSNNFATAGVTLTLSPTLSFNPAVYISNSSPHRAFGYGVLTWNIRVW